MWAIVQMVIFVVTSLPALIKALKELFNMAGDKKLAKACVGELCSPRSLKTQLNKAAKN